WISRAAAALTALDIFWPVALHPGRHQEVCRNRLPAARGGLGDALRERRDCRDDNRRVWTLQGLCDKSLPDILHQRPFDRDVPVFSLEIVGRFTRPDV